MVQLLLIAGFILVHLREMAGDIGVLWALTPWGVAALVWGPILTVGGFVWVIVAAAGRRLDRAGRVASIRRAETAVACLRIFAGLWYAVCLFAFDWPGAVRSVVGDLILLDDLIIVSPLLAALILAVHIIYPIERRLRESLQMRHFDEGRPVHQLWSRRAYVWSAVRHQMLFVLVPVCTIFAWGEFVDRGARWMGWMDASGRSSEASQPVGIVLAQLAGVIVILALMPLVMRIVWDTVPLADGPLRDRLAEICRAHRVKVRDLLVWRTQGTMINGAAMGIVGPARYILLSDALLENLSEPQVEAVAAHEVAHVRCKHTLWLAMAMLATVTIVGGILGFGGALLPRALANTVGATVATVGSLAAGLLVMGLVSRRFEWQADAFAAKHMARRTAEITGEPAVITPEAVTAMTGALQAVADLNGIPTERSSFRHGSIAARQRKLRALIGIPVDRVRIDRQVGVLRVVTVIGLVVAGALITLGYAVN